MASIAKTYDCSPPAISYIVSRSRARHANGTAAPAVTEPQLIKTHAHPATVPGPVETPVEATASVETSIQDRAAAAAATPLFAQEAPQLHRDQGTAGHNGNGAEQDPAHRDPGFPGLPPAALRPASTDSAQRPPEQHRTLHLGFGNAGANHSNGAAAAPPPAAQVNGGMMIAEPLLREISSSPAPHRVGGEQHQPRPAAPAPRPYDQPRYSYGQPEHHNRPGNSIGADKDASGSYIDQDLRARVDGDIAAFLSAFDAALAQDNQDSRSALREATDRLLRAGARTRIELERLEARVPLPPRDSAARSAPAWPSR